MARQLERGWELARHRGELHQVAGRACAAPNLACPPRPRRAAAPLGRRASVYKERVVSHVPQVG